jgi:TolC family type I secretion outer membrane protein
MTRESLILIIGAVTLTLAAGRASGEPAAATAPTGSAGGPPAVSSAATTTAASRPIQAGERLSLERCVEIGLRRSPAIAAAESTLNAAGARVGQARSAYYPQVGLSGAYTAFSPYTDPGNNAQDLYQGTASLNQIIYDFGRTPSQVRIQRFNQDASRSDRRNTVSQVVYGIKQAYYALLQAEKNRDVAVETVKLTQDQLDQARGFFDAGVKSKYDVTSAEVNLSNAKLALIRAENTVKVSRVTLNNVMGVPDAPEFEIEDTLAFQKNLVTYQDAVQRAYTNRPDLLALQSRREASRESVSLARTGYYPALTGSANYNRTDDHFMPERSGWNAGVTLTIPLFTGFLTQNQVKEARENLNTTMANEESLRQGILLEVQQSYLNLRALEDGVTVAELTVRQAQENYDIVNGRYNAGVGSPLDVTNALVVLANAKTNYIAALASYKVAEAALLKAMGD